MANGTLALGFAFADTRPGRLPGLDENALAVGRLHPHYRRIPLPPPAPR
ncbi:hypothetical protein Q3W71_08515 [Micromonospora sp. C28SCA-DRY-2]|nr:hypothetical protein [Micromonospora sp. C28SCA-DRY-2]MDO3701722.1 hypothetical protein [Micromonospora sp. C28SCA-DRY-2]